ncbi:glycoside hydrolase family 76 protein [Podospora appendiculata]|uniref:Glycoside hydrolase family 76 protein n=1 Tax=Podospora appendiculata TaxID=314037 RepID=A0AAE0X9C1_9PEZI|nr:glycoside hydrolase family 76 protein [Podospora appendiculata]
MVSTRWGGLAARAVFIMSTHFTERATKASYSSDALAGVKALQGWSDSNTLSIASIISNTYTNAQSTSATAQKTISTTGRITSTYSFQANSKQDELGIRGFSGFINNFYDDEGWWALALVRSWDLTHDPGYLDMAERIFDDMRNGTDSTCGGGIWWSKDRKYKNAIANELYLTVAASLANRVPSSDKSRYLKIAMDEWAWFKKSGMINADNLINDGLTLNADGTCVNNKMQTWSYNQGVILGGLVELSTATGDPSYLSQAVSIAKAAITALSDENGIIHEIDNCDSGKEPDCGDDGSQFKGIFVRNLHYLFGAVPQDAFRATILNNADSIWTKNRNSKNQLGLVWTGPPEAGNGPTAGTHSSALDVLVAALAVAS